LNRLVSLKKARNFDNLYIPGFNRTYDGDFGVGLNYTVSYFIPIFKKKVIPVEVPKKKQIRMYCLKNVARTIDCTKVPCTFSIEFPNYSNTII
jgi:hypothetical protein